MEDRVWIRHAEQKTAERDKLYPRASSHQDIILGSKNLIGKKREGSRKRKTESVSTQPTKVHGQQPTDKKGGRDELFFWPLKEPTGGRPRATQETTTDRDSNLEDHGKEFGGKTPGPRQ